MLLRSKENCQNVESCLLTSTDETTCVVVYILKLDRCGLFRQLFLYAKWAFLYYVLAVSS